REIQKEKTWIKYVELEEASALIVTVLLAGHAGSIVYPTSFRPAQSAESNKINPQLPVIPSRKFVITSFGAIGDGSQSNTEAFRKAITSGRFLTAEDAEVFAED